MAWICQCLRPFLNFLKNKHTGLWVKHQGFIGENETTGEAALPLLFCFVGLVDSQSEF
jgi:hypothetical protein